MFGFNTFAKDYDLKVELTNCFNTITIVYLAQHRPSGKHVAVKKYQLDKADEECNLIYQEILTLRQFNHPNILSSHTAFVHNYEIFLVSPLMCFGSCKDTLRNCFVTGFPELLIALILRDVLLGLNYIHNRGYVHRSIRASHILLNDTKAVLCGFRESSSMACHGKLYKLPPFCTKSLNWLAPEVLEQNLLGYTAKSDVYSIGATTCELANGFEPFADMQTTFMLTEKIRGNQPTILDDSTCPTEAMLDDAAFHQEASARETRQIYCERKFSDAFHKFSEICLERLPADRPSVANLLNHTFFKQCRHTNLQVQLALCGVETTDYSTLRDETIGISSNLEEVQLNETFEWNFSEL